MRSAGLLLLLSGCASDVASPRQAPDLNSHQSYREVRRRLKQADEEIRRLLEIAPCPGFDCWDDTEECEDLEIYPWFDLQAPPAPPFAPGWRRVFLR